MTPEIEKILADNHDLTATMIARCEKATAYFGDLAAYLTAGYAEDLDSGGLWECDHCGEVVEDPAHPDCGEPAVILHDDTILCHDCYSAAIEAAAKIVVHDDDGCNYEDVSALTDEEQLLASYIAASRERVSRRG